MDKKALRELLQQVANGKTGAEVAAASLEKQSFTDIGFANVDLARQKRNGYPEVIYGEGKTAEQIVEIAKVLQQQTAPILATRVSPEKFGAVKIALPEAIYYKEARCTVIGTALPQTKSYIAIVTAGTSDVPVAEEAAITAETFGNQVERVYDVGVAGIQRLFARLDVIRGAKVVIVIAGMEGALASVVGGLINKPLIAVPTSIGYGTNFGGLTALMTMLNSCASGITVVNVDNGFGAAYSASMINHL
ncbi:nickel pincer cofactor biosynthesis protein LarB [Loigolactobacillus iwatensis]|uniref:nickel pincer cofactor biosynthesis protein LarB n=1 Tax=Loigolactobacillus iwatensis TaxID=1267156 RepID=UPI000F7F7557|nr:nickel pincer cofactor biosynthesis protein LarB [Loigolactobacillus iwatensis]